MNLDASFDKATLRSFTRTVQKTADVTNRSAFQAIIFAAIKFVVSAQARSKPSRMAGQGKKKREIIENPNFVSGGADNFDEGGARYFIVALHQNDKRVLIPTNNRQDRRRIIRRRGLMKSSFAWMLRDLNSRQGASSKHRRMGGVTRVRKNKRVIEPTIRLQNFLQYVLKPYPNIVGESLKAASKSMIAQIEKKIKPRIKREWTR